jgi:integrase
VAGDGTRKTVRMGKASMKQADAFKSKVEALVTAGITGHMDDEIARWTAGLEDTIHERLAAVGLVKQRTGGRAVLGPFIDSYIDGRPDIKPNTKLNLKQVRRWLVGHFKETRDMRTITPADAEDWRAYMLKEGLGENTIRRHVGRAGQLFKAAIRRGLVRGANPFDGMAKTVRADKARQFFVTREATAKVIAACPDAEWKLIIALSRFGGVRCPSETLAMTWSDVDWEHNRIRVPSPKTEHHEGKESRLIPLFPELRQPLLDVFEQAEEGAVHVITRYRDKYSNLRTQFGRIVERAGLKPWPKLLHNLRSTRQTELCEKYPIHVVCAWLGNSRAVAMEHYLQVTDTHFTQAAEAAQNPAQYPAGTGRNTSQSLQPEKTNLPELPGDTVQYETVHKPNYPRQDSNL